MDKTEKMQLVQKIIFQDVGEIRAGNKYDGFYKVPKLYVTLGKFTSHLKDLKKDGSKKYKGLEIDFILDFCNKGKQRKIAHTTLKQLNHNGKVDTIHVIGKAKEKVVYG